MHRTLPVFLTLLVTVSVLLSGCPKTGPESPGGESRPSTAPEAGTPSENAGAVPAAGGIQLKGSDTLLQVAQGLAEAYKTAKTDVPVSVTGGGTGTGFTALADGTCDIADASRKIKDEEKSTCEAKGVQPVENLVGHDGIAVIVNKANPIQKLTIDQLSDLFIGQTTDWQALGGKGEVVLLSRDSTSGTYEYFKEHVIQKGDKNSKRDFAAAAQRLQSNDQIRDQVASVEGAIGYVGLGYLTDTVKVVPIVDKAGKPITPSLQTVRDATYPISRPLFMYTRSDARQEVKDFLTWVLGAEGQKIVEAKGFVPVK
ncbi:phosphate ABC transporter substrate-binding protein [bacterium]|nr:phosphate ABC transporter substrate-binding protein [bacterium]